MSILDNAKDIADLIKKYNDQDLYERIINLRDEIFRLKDENRELKEKLFALKQQLAEKEMVEWESPYYWKLVAGEKTGPFCQHCRDSDEKLAHLHPGGTTGSWICKVCNNSYTDKDYVQPTTEEIAEAFSFGL